MRQNVSTICAYHPAIAWNGCAVGAPGSTAFASTSSGESASAGGRAMRSTWRSSTTTGRIDMTAKLRPVHPGDVLLEEFIRPMGISQYRVANDISVPPRRINEIVHGKRSVSADSALRLSRYFGTSE